MRYTPAEKFEIIRLVEQVDVPAKRVLAECDTSYPVRHLSNYFNRERITS